LKETDESPVVAIVFTESSLRRIRQFRTRRTSQGRIKKRGYRSPELVWFVSEVDRNEANKELVEPVDVAGRVGCKVTRPVDCPPERGIRTAFAMEIPPTCRFENDKRIRRWWSTGGHRSVV